MAIHGRSASDYRLILSNEDRVNIIQGNAGTGKTETFGAVKEYADKEGLDIIGIAATGKASKEIADKDIPAYTIDSFYQGPVPQSTDHHHNDESYQLAGPARLPMSWKEPKMPEQSWFSLAMRSSFPRFQQAGCLMKCRIERLSIKRK